MFSLEKENSWETVDSNHLKGILYKEKVDIDCDCVVSAGRTRTLTSPKFQTSNRAVLHWQLPLIRQYIFYMEGVVLLFLKACSGALSVPGICIRLFN